jgi:hypothetical protein
MVPGSLYWIDDPQVGGVRVHAQIPFADTFSFRDGTTAVMLIYYWTTLILFFPCVERLQIAVQERVMDAWGPQTYPNIPERSLMTNNPLRYGAKEVRELAANVCRSLDFALGATVQPDILTLPLFVVNEFYREINDSSGDGQLELMWCDGFRMRLQDRGQIIAHVVQGRRWQELATY